MSRARAILEWPLHPPCLAAAFVLSIAFTNDVPLAGVARSLAIASLASVLLVGVLWLVFRDLARASLIASTALVALLSHDLVSGAARLMTAAVGVGGAVVAVGVVVYLALACGAVAILRGVRLRRVSRHRLHRGANQAAVILLATVLLTGAAGGVRDALGQAPAHVGEIGCEEATRKIPAASLPDIYQILLDGYPRADVLGERFGYDNRPFIEQLRLLGFVVDDKSHSNYALTALTFASMFNMRYVQDLPRVAPLVGKPVEARSELRDAITNGAVFSVLKQAGYRVITTASGWEHVTTRAAADEFLDHGNLTDLERDLIEKTWLPELISTFAGDWFAAQQRSRIVNEFSDIAAVAQRPDHGPIFLFAHFPIPHHPIVFAADGQPLHMTSLRDWRKQVSYLGLSDDQYGAAYVNQLASANGMVLGAIAAIAASNRHRPAVVIVMSDHGYNHELRRIDPRDRFSNLFAARTPGDPALFAGGVTPVNLFRKLFDQYLGTCAGALPDRHYISPTIMETMNFVEVADPEAHVPPTFDR